MKKLCIAAALLCTLTASIAQHSADADLAVLAAEKARTTALVQGDTVTLEKLLADDLTYVHASGKVDTKASFLEGIKSGELHYIAWEPKSMHVRVVGQTGVLNGEYAVRVRDRRVQAEPFDINVFILSVYARRDGRWQQIAWQSTKDVGIPASH